MMVVHYGKGINVDREAGVSGIRDFALCMEEPKPANSLRLSPYVSRVTCKRCLKWIRRSQGEG